MNHTSIWRYIFIVVLISLGILYALPNLYGDDPAVQVSIKGGADLPTTLVAPITAVLQEQHIAFKSIVADGNDYLIRLDNPETQAHAQDVIQATLGDSYTVALNLAPRTPAWLQAIGAQSMKLGLDLRGGIHFLYQVDVDSMLKERVKGDMRAIGDQLRDGMIRYTAILPINNGTGLSVRFNDASARDQASSVIQKNFPDYTVTPSQSGAFYSVDLTMMPTALQNLKEYAVSQNITTLNRRINALGVSEPVIAQQGADQISIDLPGIQDTARAKEEIGALATVQFRLVDTDHDAASVAQSGLVPFGDTLYRFNGTAVLLKNQIVLAGTSITSAISALDQNGRPAVSITVGGDGLNYFNDVTSNNVGKPMATVYIQTEIKKTLVNGAIHLQSTQVEKIINIATIQSALGRDFQIMGLDSANAASDLALQLQSGAYAAPFVAVEEQVVGPSMGQQNIAMGVKACEIGSLFVFLFMMFYYRVFGLVADLALTLNVIFVVAVQSLMGFTMTLPGIAALVLTVGMAVDANVLIYERIREELRLGMSPQAAIAAGYDRAFTTIVDANVTTLIVASVLFSLGTGAVQGFAVTLSIGILTSMFTSIFVTRSIINLIYGRVHHLKSISIGIKMKMTAANE